LDGVTPGTTTASKALVVGANKNLDVLALPVSGLKIGAGAGTAVDATAAELNLLSGAGAVVASGTQGSTVTAVGITISSNDPSITANGSLTIADGDSISNDEIIEAIIELNAKVTALSAALDAFGITA
jgi:hypothetical protein